MDFACIKHKLKLSLFLCTFVTDSIHHSLNRIQPDWSITHCISFVFQSMSHADVFFGASSRSGSTTSDSSSDPAPIPSSSCLDPIPILSSNSSSSSDGNVPSCGFVNSCYFVSLFISNPFNSRAISCNSLPVQVSQWVQLGTKTYIKMVHINALIIIGQKN